MDDRGHIVVLVTAATEAEAQRIRDVLLHSRQAACVSIVAHMSSAYWWKGHIESAEEHLLIAKTRASCLNKLINLVKHNHSYSVPEIIAVPVVGGNPDYLRWIDEEVCKE